MLPMPHAAAGAATIRSTIDVAGRIM
jgi:hypothetical protein